MSDDKLEALEHIWTSPAAKEFFDQIQKEIAELADKTFGHRQMSPAEYVEAKRQFEQDASMLRKEAASLVARHTSPKLKKSLT